MRIVEPEFLLGNVLKDPKERIALNVLHNVTHLRKGCDAQGCKVCGLNRILQDGLADGNVPLLTQDLANDPFFG